MEAGGESVPARAGFDLSFPRHLRRAARLNQFLLAQVVEVFGEKHLMVVDLLSRSGDRLVTDRSGQALQALARQGLATIVDLGTTGAPASTFTVVPGSVVAAPRWVRRRPVRLPLDVLRRRREGRGVYALYNAATLMAVVAGDFSGAGLFATSSESDLASRGPRPRRGTSHRLVTPAGRPFTLTLRDVDSGLGALPGRGDAGHRPRPGDARRPSDPARSRGPGGSLGESRIRPSLSPRLRRCPAVRGPKLAPVFRP